MTYECEAIYLAEWVESEMRYNGGDRIAKELRRLYEKNIEQAAYILKLEYQLAQWQVPAGWQEQFKQDVYTNLAAADNQDVPLEEYPDRILTVLTSIVGPRHPTVVQWRNDAINNCLAIAYKYCCDSESYKYLKQDLEAIRTPPQREPLTDAQIRKLSYAFLGDNGPQDTQVIKFTRAIEATHGIKGEEDGK